MELAIFRKLFFNKIIYGIIDKALLLLLQIRKEWLKYGISNNHRNVQKAYEGTGAFNVNNMEIIQGITEAAKEENAPIILQVSAGARKYANHNYLVN